MQEQTAAINRLIALSSPSPTSAPTVMVPKATVMVLEFLGPQAAGHRSVANPGAPLHATPYPLNSKLKIPKS